MARSWTAEEISKAEDFIIEHSRGAPAALGCYWISDGDVGDNFCLECCEKMVASIAEKYPDACVDGGWRTEHDSPPYCETCGVMLDGALTDYGVREELRALTGECQPDFDDASAWYQLENALIDMPHTDLSVWGPVCRTVRRALRKERHAIRKAHLHSMRPGMRGARLELLSVFGSRMVQKAPEPSFALWDELESYTRLSHANRWTPDAATRDLEKRLYKESKRFLAMAGTPLRGDCAQAPYGNYYWTFAVEIEQERLWNFPEFQQGRAHMQSPWPHNRDDNPYKERARARSWDCGYISAMYDAGS